MDNDEITISLDGPVCPGCGVEATRQVHCGVIDNGGPLTNVIHEYWCVCALDYIARRVGNEVYISLANTGDENVAKCRDFTVRDLAEMYLAKKWELENYKAMARFVSQAE